MANPNAPVANVVPSLIRTYVPIIIGAVVTWLALKGVHMDPGTRTGLTALVTSLVSAAYYTVVRLIETKVPAVGLLLGYKKQPVYVNPVGPVDQGGRDGGSVSSPQPDRPVGPFRPA